MLNIETVKTFSMSQVKEFCVKNGIEAAINWIQSETVQNAIETTKTATVKAAEKVWEVATSEQAKESYITIAAYLIVGLMLIGKLIGKGFSLLWSNRFEVPYVSYAESQLVSLKNAVINWFETGLNRIEIAENQIQSNVLNLIGSVYNVHESATEE